MSRGRWSATHWMAMGWSLVGNVPAQDANERTERAPQERSKCWPATAATAATASTGFACTCAIHTPIFQRRSSSSRPGPPTTPTRLRSSLPQRRSPRAPDRSSSTSIPARPPTRSRAAAPTSRSGDLVVSVDRDDEGQAIRALATDGEQSLLWMAESGQVRFYPARRFHARHDIDSLWGPLSTDPDWHAAMANLPWTSRALTDGTAGAELLLRSAMPGRHYEIEVDGEGRPIRVRYRFVDDPAAPPAHLALYAFAAMDSENDDDSARLAASLRVRQSGDRLSVDGAVLRHRSNAAP